MPAVSVVIPVYNSEKYVEKCIQSVMAQTLPDLEIIIINDGSTDESGRILRELTQKDSRIVLLEQANQGVAAARNQGVEKATGKYITFVDGDDYLQEDYIELMYNLAEKETLDMVICGLTYVDEGGKELNRVVPGVYKRLENEEWTFRVSAVCSHLYRRELWKRYDVKFQSGDVGKICRFLCSLPLYVRELTLCRNAGIIMCSTHRQRFTISKVWKNTLFRIKAWKIL